ncbi:hypothetical protein EPA93_08490 [Ktedonosporobacter rubrisoli]|uniref:CTP synthase (glutamine hydrolyzing) n=1 Tax=Ktedonosporobacter rubrisoli TaxID=2509675 RepID=A0A4P6JM18_KTERU|nr:hypothetical protein [Ktedonosporobacter rubrisoli]QBD76042.1 hypothetical protein EPA93_08490 [Ktedonosporobacter rubrisoli]
MLQLALIGEFKPDVTAHIAIPRALELAANAAGYQLEFDWLPTTQLEREAEQQLASYQAVWFVPNTPYVSMAGALNGIKYARERGVPALGTCGGCQYMLIEYARNKLGMLDADHAENNPEASIQLITPLACTRTEVITNCLLVPDSRVATIYGASEITEQYGTCNYGPNAKFWPALEQGGMHISGVDSEGEARIIELSEHPFFIGTLFQPERSALKQLVHPLIKAWLQAAAQAA